FGVRAAADQKRRPGVRDPERDRRERAARLVAELLEAADPELALVLRPHVVAARVDGVALDRLALEGVALGGPVLGGGGLEVEVERLAVGAERQHALRRVGGGRGGGGQRNPEQQAQQARHRRVPREGGSATTTVYQRPVLWHGLRTVPPTRPDRRSPVCA